MQVRSFGLLLAGLLPVGAFAEPEYEMSRAPEEECDYSPLDLQLI